MRELADLKGAAARGLFWSSIDRFGAQGVNFLFGIGITRLLFPEDYGLLGMILIFMALGQNLADSGFGAALIWKKKTTPTDYSTVFYFTLFVSFVLYFIFYLIAPYISKFYNEPRLINLIRVLCLNFIFLSVSLIQQVDLQKKVDFKALSLINVSGSIVAGTIALYMAYAGFGVWALIFQILIRSLNISLLLWIFNRWRPKLIFSWHSLSHLFSYGSRLMMASLIYTFFQYFYLNIIGKLFSVTSLGFYTRAVQLQEFPIKTMSSIFNRVAFPIFATIQDQNQRLRNAFRKTLRSMMFVMYPVIFGLIAIADELIEVVFTEKWLPASPYFKLLCLIGIFYVFQVINGELLKTKGMSKLVLRLELITKTILVILFFVTYRWGIQAIIVGQLITSAVAAILGGYYVWKLIKYSVWGQIKDASIFLMISGLMYLLLKLVSHFMDTSVVSLLIMIVSGAIFYLLIAWILRLEEIKELEQQLNTNFISKK